LQSADDEKIDEGLDIFMTSGLYASLWLSQRVFPVMREQGGGRIINFGSITSTFGSRHSLGYNTTKEAIAALTRTLANEWGQYDITVNTILPAGPSPAHKVLAESKLRLASENPKYAEQLRQYQMTAPYQPFVIAPDGEDIGGAVVGIASESGRFITGQIFYVDGGLHLWGLNQLLSLPGQEYHL
jgi:NAD(P)-dependent dehydrogenase (short-subunit alcohol dehydrogenase family)